MCVLHTSLLHLHVAFVARCKNYCGPTKCGGVQRDPE